MGNHDRYVSPLASRNASPEMLRIWSPRHKFDTWRRIWLAVAQAQHEATRDREGGALVTSEQVEELRAVVERGIRDEEIQRADEIERDLRHDVMAHVHCLGEQCPKARPIIHLGCTSQDVVCNADLMIQGQAGALIDAKLRRAAIALGDFAQRTRTIPTLGFTHYQPAQPTTVGRRAAGWAYDLLCSAPQEHAAERHRLRGFRGATGTQASFLALFDNDPALVDAFEARAVFLLRRHIGWEDAPGFDDALARHGGNARQYLDRHTFTLTGQTYPRVVDVLTLSRLGAIASALHKIATDIRLLSNRKELDEPFGDRQIGSSAMPYKRNPMRCERICGLARFVMNLAPNASDTAATQWLERTLDDSSNRRLSIPEAFLALDGTLDLMHNVADGLVVHEKMIHKNLMLELPFLATENILMAAVRAGGDRQDLHERIRVHAQAAGQRVKDEGLDNDQIDRLLADPAFRSKAVGGSLDAELDWDDLLNPMRYVGRAPAQTERFVREVLEAIRVSSRDDLDRLGTSEPRV